MIERFGSFVLYMYIVVNCFTYIKEYCSHGYEVSMVSCDLNFVEFLEYMYLVVCERLAQRQSSSKLLLRLENV